MVNSLKYRQRKVNGGVPFKLRGITPVTKTDKGITSALPWPHSSKS